MSNAGNQAKANHFLDRCFQDCRRIYPNMENSHLIQHIFIQLTTKVFELEAQIKELKNDRL